MGVPATSGKLCTALNQMSIGDYIKIGVSTPANGGICKFTGVGSNVGSDLTELPADSPCGTSPNGYAYMVKVDKGFCVCDRAVQGNVLPTDLVKEGLIGGKLVNGIGLFRLLSRAEFRRYIATSSLEGTATPADGNVWHGVTSAAIAYDPKYSCQLELLQDRKLDTIGINGNLSMGGDNGVDITGYAYNNTGPISYFYPMNTKGFVTDRLFTFYFRPCLEYVDNPKSTDVFK